MVTAIIFAFTPISGTCEYVYGCHKAQRQLFKSGFPDVRTAHMISRRHRGTTASATIRVRFEGSPAQRLCEQRKRRVGFNFEEASVSTPAAFSTEVESGLRSRC